MADIGFYADTLLRTFEHGRLCRLLAEVKGINNRVYNLDTGRHHHYTAKPSHLLLSTSLSGLHGSSGDVIRGCVCVRLVCSSKANRTCLGHAVVCRDVNDPICDVCI